MEEIYALKKGPESGAGTGRPCRQHHLLFGLSPELQKLYIVGSGGKMYQELDSNSFKHVSVRDAHDFSEVVDFGSV